MPACRQAWEYGSIDKKFENDQLPAANSQRNKDWFLTLFDLFLPDKSQ